MGQGGSSQGGKHVGSPPPRQAFFHLYLQPPMTAFPFGKQLGRRYVPVMSQLVWAREPPSWRSPGKGLQLGGLLLPRLFMAILFMAKLGCAALPPFVCV